MPAIDIRRLWRNFGVIGERTRLTVVLMSNNLTINGGFHAALEAEGWRWVDAAAIDALHDDLLSQRVLIVILTSKFGTLVNACIRELATYHDVPVVIFCANYHVVELCQALDAGAEDVIPIPFSEEEAVARLRAVVRVRYLSDL